MMTEQERKQYYESLGMTDRDLYWHGRGYCKGREEGIQKLQALLDENCRHQALIGDLRRQVSDLKKDNTTQKGKV